MTLHKLKKRALRFYKSVWLFPAAVLLLLILLTAFRIHGSSIGVYHDFLYGDSQEDPNLVFGEPRPIRSDEWLFVSQFAFAQEEAGYPRVNENLFNGRDVSIVGDVPYKGWSTIFRPQNISFLILPFEYAFAFKWWFLLAMLLISTYFFALRVLQKKSLAILLSLIFSFSPFVFWWYQTATLATIFYGLFMILLAMRIIDGKPFLRIKSRFVSMVVQVGVFIYLLSSFALILYPPFQIPVLFSVAVFLVGYLLHKRQANQLKHFFRRIFIPLGIVAVCSATIVGLFVATRFDALQDTSNTVYPGVRAVQSGGVIQYHMFTGPAQPFLQDDEKAGEYFKNQSTASNFILLTPFILLPAMLMASNDYFNRKKIDWMLTSLITGNVLLLAWAFIPRLNVLFKPLFFEQVPHSRILMGFGVMGFFLLVYFIKRLLNDKIPKQLMYTLLVPYGLLVVTVVLASVLFTEREWEPFTEPKYLFLLSSITLTVVVLSLLTKKIYFSLALLLAFTFISVYRIHPLYIGTGPMVNNDLIAKIDSITEEDAVWGIADDIRFENHALLAGENSITGIQLYPDLDYWRRIAGSEYDDIYNRYAHVQLTTGEDITEPFNLVQKDSFQIHLTCSDFILENVDYVVNTKKELDLPCLEKIDEVEYPEVHFKIYEVAE